LVRAREPARLIGPLVGLDVQLGLDAAHRHRLALARGKELVEHLPVALAGLLDVLEAEDPGLDRRYAAADAELEAPARQVVEHADLAVEAVGVVPGQAEGEGTGAQAARALEER